VTAPQIQRAIAQVWKEESARVIGGLARIVRDVALAEDMAQEALLAALQEWPKSGVPDRPGAWLMTTARNRALNALKRGQMIERAGVALGHETASHVPLEELQAAFESRMDVDVKDDVLRLIFAACHPALTREARVTLTLKMVGGLSTDEIARAFLSNDASIAQRVVRAKRTLGEAHVPFELPRGAELNPRLSSVLEVIYLVFNEGYAATAGDDLMRPELSEEALRLGELLATLAPEEPEVHALLALMRLQASRAAARTDAAGDPVLLHEQDRSRWDAKLIADGLSSLEHAQAPTQAPGPYQLQAAIAACHARARTAEETDWTEIARLYGALAERTPSPVVELNRAVAISRAQGPAAGLTLLDALVESGELERFHLLPAARADLLEQLARFGEAAAEFERAAVLTENARQRRRLEARVEACRRKAAGPVS
jgi:RNA polymerase sigma factor (sigma-70 family)